MKQKDIAMIIIVAFFAGVVSFLISGMFFTPENSKNLEAEVVQEITTEFNPSEERYKRFFNDKAINPTKLIQIGDQKNKKPF
ncbi:hypothetical protein KY385_03965 [Candidatus Parcubacteria bacterium]|nr:hypothetical protein [Candidatus Parcubacteria bacterium]